MSKSQRLDDMILDLSMPTAKFNQDTKGAVSIVGRFEQKTNRRLKKVDAGFGRMNKSVQMAKAGMLAFAAAGAAAVFGLARASIDAAGDLEKLQNTANKLGVDTEWLQEMRFAANQVGIQTTTLEMALQRLGRRMGEISNFGAGEAKKTFEELGISIKRTDGTVKSLADIMPELADKFSKMDDAARRNSYAMKLFDSEGVAMVQLMREGAIGLEKFQQRARDLGIVIDRHTVASAQKMKDEFDAATQSAKQQLIPGLIAIMPILVDLASAASSVASWFADLVDRFRDIENVSTRGLKNKLAEIKSELKNGLIWDEQDEQALRDQESKITAILNKRAEQGKKLNQVTSTGLPKGAAGDTTFKDALGDLDKQILSEEMKAVAIGKTAGQVARMNAELKITEDLKKGNIKLSNDEHLKLQSFLIDLELKTDKTNALAEAEKARLEKVQTAEADIEKVEKERLQSLQDMGDAVTNNLDRAFQNLAENGKLNVREMVNSMIKDLARIAAKQAAMRIVSSFFGAPSPQSFGVSGLYEKGGIFNRGREVNYFAKGGIVSSPTAFAMPSGIGVMGEAGHEAIMPVSKGKGGKLGVDVSGVASPIKVTVINNSPSHIQVDQPSRGEVVIIAEQVANKVVSDRAPDVISGQLAQPNSKTSKALKQNFNTQRKS